MQKGFSFFVLLVSIVNLSVLANSQERKEFLRLVQTIPLPDVKGRLDHMDVVVKGKRLFVAGLENGSVEVVDLGQADAQHSRIQKATGHLLL